MKTTFENSRTDPYLVMFKAMKTLLATALAIASALTVQATDVKFTLGPPYFNASPASNRVVTLQALTPFRGNPVSYTSDVSGIFYASNLAVGDYAGVIRPKGNAGQIEFMITVTATDLGTVDAHEITSLGSVQTYPTAGRSSWTIQASDARYSPIGAGGLSFTPQFGTANLTNWAALSTNVLGTIGGGSLFLDSASVSWSTIGGSNVAALTSNVTNDWRNYTLAASNSITAAMTNQNTGTSNGLYAHIYAAVATNSTTGNAATATTASNVAAAVTNDWRNYTLAASNSLYSTIVTQECVEVFTSDTNRIYATLAGTAAANGTYHWNASLVSYTNTTGCGIYTEDIYFFITNASALYVGVGNNFDVTWDVDTGGSPPPVTRFGTNSTVYCADIPAAFQSASFNSNALYLSVGGNDLFAVRGNPLRPWKTFSACLTNAVQGDVVFVGPGTFTNHLGSGATTRASIIGSGKTTTTIHGPILIVGGSNIMFKDFTYDAYTFIQGHLKVSGTNIFFDNLKILGQQDGIFMQGWDNFKGANLSIESEWDCIADYQWASVQRSNAVAQFYNCDLFSRDTGNSFPPTCVSVGSSQLKFFGGSMIASNGAAGFTSCLLAQAGGSAAAHLGRITLANVSLLAASTNGAAYSLRWATNGQIFTAGMSISPDRISGSPLITSLDSGADLFPGIIISTNTGSSINSVGLTNGNVTIPGTLSVSGATTAGTLYSPSISGDGLGITNAVDLIAGNNITITTNANKRSFTIDSTGGTSGALTNNETRDITIYGDMMFEYDGNESGRIIAPWATFTTIRALGNTMAISNGSINLRLNYVSGDVTNFVFTGAQVIADGSGITNINAANISGDLVVETLTVATQYVTDSIIGNGSGVTNLNATNLASGTVPIGLLIFDSYTNNWSLNTAFVLGRTNSVLSSGAATGGITGVANLPSSETRFGELTIKCTGDITFTNPASIRANDWATSRVFTNGNVVEIAVKVIPGLTTNLSIVQFK